MKNAYTKRAEVNKTIRDFIRIANESGLSGLPMVGLKNNIRTVISLALKQSHREAALIKCDQMDGYVEGLFYAGAIEFDTLRKLRACDIWLAVNRMI